MSAAAKLEALLARVQTNRAKPRVVAAASIVAAPAAVMTPTPAPQSPFAVAMTPTPAPKSPVGLPPSALVGGPPVARAPQPPPESHADAPTPPRGLRTPVPPSPAAPIRSAAPTPSPAPASPVREHRPTPLEMAVVGEAEHESSPARPLAAKQIAPSAGIPPSMPIVRMMSEAVVPERATFGALLRRTLALRPR